MNTLVRGAEWRRAFTAGVFVGSALGAALALLCAPASGKKLRLSMKEKVNALLSETRKFIEKAKGRASTSLHEAKRAFAKEQSRIIGAVRAGVDADRKAKEVRHEA